MGLPSLRALDGAQAARIWLAMEATDMRCGFDLLAERVKTVIGENPLSGHLFVFRSRRGDRLKILHWDRDGLEVELGRPGRRAVVAAVDCAGELGGGEGQTLLRHRLDSVKPLQSLRQFVSGKFQMDYSSRLGSHAGRRCMKQ
jgi:transposase